MPTLIVRNGSAARRRLDVSAPATLGSASLPDDLAILPRHCVTTPGAGGTLEVTLEPGATAWLNDGVAPEGPFTLRPGDMLGLGATWLELEHPVLTSASVMLHLEIERLNAEVGKGGTIAPRTGQGFETRQISAVLLAAAFWALREYGLVRLDALPQEDPMLAGPFIPIGVTPLATTTRYGIEARILAALVRPLRVDEIVKLWFPVRRIHGNRYQNHYDPWGDVVDYAVDGMGAAGMLDAQPEERRGFLGLQWDTNLSSDSKRAVVRPDVFATYGRYSDRWLQRWFGFHAAEQWFGDALVRECARALRRAQYIDRN